MDFKGIAWAGNIYQKFEAMCLEVEEVMYQDTVKYVENQVQKVGVSVKKFYSEVMQDVLPPSSVDPVKVAAGDLSLNPYAHTDVIKKPKSFLLDSARELKKIKTGDEAISELISEKLSSLSVRDDVNHFPPPCYGVLVQNALAESCSAKSNRLGVYRRPIGIKRISRVDRPSKVSSPATSLSECRSDKIAARDGRGSYAEASGDKKAVSPSDVVERRHLEEVPESTPALDTSNNCPVSDNIKPNESVRQTKDAPEHISSLDSSVNNISSSGKCENITTNAFDIEPIDESVVTFNEGKSVKDQSSLNTSVDTCDSAFEVKEAVLSDEDDFDLETVENQEVAESVIEISETFERSNLEETCVLVAGDDFASVLQGAKRHKSYKKKIREALSSKLRPTRKQGCTDFGGKNNTKVASPCDVKTLALHDSLESEWELL